MNLLQSFQPPLHLCLAAAHLVTVDAELAGDLGLRESFLHVVSAGGQPAVLVGGEGDDGLSVDDDFFHCHFIFVHKKLHVPCRQNFCQSVCGCPYAHR